MSSQENTMDAEEYENWIEQHLTDVAECGAGRMGRKARWEIDKARRASELESLSLNTTTEAIEPGEEIKWGTSPVKEGTQQVESTVKMGPVDRMMVGDNLVVPTHAPKGSHTTLMDDTTEPETEVGENIPRPGLECRCLAHMFCAHSRPIT